MRGTRASEDAARRRLAAARRGTAVAIALLIAALAAAGCGIGPGRGLGEVQLTVTREYGAEPVAAARDDVSESDTVMRVLDRNAEISTLYGGGFVQSIEGIEGTQRGGRPHDWFFYVNGVESPVGAADYPLHGGEAIWWDRRDWSAAMRVPAVVGSWPQPFAGGYEGRRRPVAVECMGAGGACAEVRSRLEQVGARVRSLSRYAGQSANAAAGGSASAGRSGPQSDAPSGAIRVLVGPWARLREDPAAAQLEAGPQVSGVFADFARAAEGRSGNPAKSRSGNPGGLHGFRLLGLDEAGDVTRPFGPGAGLVAATRYREAPPVWLVTGAGSRGVRAAAELLDAADLDDHYAVVAAAGRVEPLPLVPSKPGRRTAK